MRTELPWSVKGEGLMSSTPPFDIGPEGRRSQRRANRGAPAAHQPSAYRLDVLGGDVIEMVQYVGGWLFDQVMAGWHIDIDVQDVEDVRPLRILGIQQSRRSTLEATDDRFVIVVVSGEHLDTHRAARERVSTLLRGGGEVMVWGSRGQAEREYQLRDVSYPLSCAARTFKTHALTATGAASGSVDPIEGFRTGRGLRVIDDVEDGI
jgi:hypothetical protein